MFCPNCATKLQAVDTDFISQDLDGGDYYTHYCSTAVCLNWRSKWNR